MKILSGLTNGQVLQRLGSRGADVVIRGTGAGDVPIQATLFKGNAALKGWKRRFVGAMVRGKFSIKLSSIPIGGPHRLRLEAGGRRIDVSPFFVGDVWLMAGQSNMQGIGNMTGTAKPHPLIRNFSMRREWRPAEDPLHLMQESPDACHALVQCSAKAGEKLRREAIKGVGVGLFFAREMLKRSGGAPQGLISAAHGGTSMQQWSPDRKHLVGESLYASMLASVRATGQPVAGLLWYQGESDANPADTSEYVARMKKLVAATRRDFDRPQLPWMIAQIGRYFVDGADPRGWNTIQELQRLLPGKIKFLETVPAVDLSMDDAIHIGAEGFPPLGVRLAGAADRLVYKNKRELRPPQLRGARLLDRPSPCGVEVAFDCVQDGLRSRGEPDGFRFVSAEGTPLNLIFKTTLKGNKAILHLDVKLNLDCNLFYGHGFAPHCNITDGRGFPLPVFGPLSLRKAGARASLLPFITRWNVTEVVPAREKLDRVSLDEVKALGATVKNYPGEGFINERARWEGGSGQMFFQSRLHLDEAMRLEFLMGYDGPFRLWLDGKPFFVNMKGTNPCFPDESSRTTVLKPGMHDIRVGMDLNAGSTWGFFLRLARRDVTKEQVRTKKWVKPAYTV
jgi:sialate O-acetylesterase